jgi:hypothetical protein
VVGFPLSAGVTSGNSVVYKVCVAAQVNSCPQAEARRNKKQVVLAV